MHGCMYECMHACVYVYNMPQNPVLTISHSSLHTCNIIHPTTLFSIFRPPYKTLVVVETHLEPCKQALNPVLTIKVPICGCIVDFLNSAGYRSQALGFECGNLSRLSADLFHKDLPVRKPAPCGILPNFCREARWFVVC